MSDSITLLSKFPIFSGMSRAQLAKIGAIVKRRLYKSGQVIIKEGDRGDSMYLLLEGSVEVSKTLTLLVNRGNVDRRDKSLVNLSADDRPSFGEMSLLGDSHIRTATIKTHTECTVGIISREECIKLCEEDTLLGYLFMRNVAQAIARRLERANKDVLKLTTAFSLALQ